MSWESSYDNWKTTPPDDPEPIMEDEFGNPIYEGDVYYDIDGVVLSKEGLAECSYSLDEGETFECEYCQEKFGEDESDDKYYLINGNKYCEGCVKDTEMVAYL